MKVVVSMVVKEKVVEAKGVSLAVKVVVSMAAKEKVVEARGASRAAKVVVSMVAKEKAVEARGANRASKAAERAGKPLCRAQSFLSDSRGTVSSADWLFP